MQTTPFELASQEFDTALEKFHATNSYADKMNFMVVLRQIIAELARLTEEKL